MIIYAVDNLKSKGNVNMNWLFILIIILVIGFIFSGIILLKQSAKKFNLSEQQLIDIRKREKELSKTEKDS